MGFRISNTRSSLDTSSITVWDHCMRGNPTQLQRKVSKIHRMEWWEESTGFGVLDLFNWKHSLARGSNLRSAEEWAANSCWAAWTYAGWMDTLLSWSRWPNSPPFASTQRAEKHYCVHVKEQYGERKTREFRLEIWKQKRRGRASYEKSPSGHQWLIYYPLNQYLSNFQFRKPVSYLSLEAPNARTIGSAISSMDCRMEATTMKRIILSRNARCTTWSSIKPVCTARIRSVTPSVIPLQTNAIKKRTTRCFCDIVGSKMYPEIPKNKLFLLESCNCYIIIIILLLLMWLFRL